MRSRLTVLFIFISIFLSAQNQKPAPKAAADSAAMPRVTVALPAPALRAMRSIDPDAIEAHTRFLASDIVEGRGTGQRGGDLAAEYLATQLQLAGLKPAGENGTYMQKVPLVGSMTEASSTMTLLPQGGQPMELKKQEQMVIMNQSQEPVVDIDADLVFVGYGIQAPEYQWDDYKGMDVKGKVLLMFVNEPPSEDPKFFKDKWLTYYGRWTYKYEQGARMGAAGVILIHKTDMASYGWEVVRNSWAGERSALKAEGPQLKLASWVQLDIAEKIFQTTGKTVDQMLQAAQSRDFKPVALPVRVKAHVETKLRNFESNNVLGMLEGSDPALKNEVVIFSGHYDHFGVHADEKGDNIYNGAVDNATGCATLLEVARAYAGASVKPKRSLLFAFVTAEEQGLLGSEYLGSHLPIAAGKVAVGLNFDAIQPWGIPEHLEVSGSERSDFYPVVQQTAKEFRLSITPDTNPGAGYYYRSDHFNLARVGIPAFSVNVGEKFRGKTAEWGAQAEADYRAKRYHQPDDEMLPDMDFRSDAYLGQFGFALGWRAANMPRVAMWKPGDEFEAARKQSLPAK